MSWLQKQIQEQIQKAEGPSIHRSICASEMIDHVYALWERGNLHLRSQPPASARASDRERENFFVRVEFVVVRETERGAESSIM